MKIYHNTRCSKSRRVLEILNEQKESCEIIKYLETIPSIDDIKDLLQKLGMKAEEIVRKKEKIYQDKFKNKTFNENEWIQILHEHPILIERPIIVKGDKAVIGRPPENVLKLL